MSQYHKEDFSTGELDFIPISLLSGKIRVLIVGGGQAGYIKAKSFANKGCSVTVVSKTFTVGFDSIAASNIQLIEAEYKAADISDKHLIVIAVSDNETIHRIVEDCEMQHKLYLNCSSFREGLFVVPAWGESEQGIVAFHTKNGSPATAKLIRDKITEQVKEYDAFIEYATRLRSSLKTNSNMAEIMRFVNTEDFMVFFQKGKHQIILKMFYGGVDFEA